jgi:hypothetical protein
MTNGRMFDQPAIYRIRVQGRLDAQWSDWFDGLRIEAGPGDQTVLTGRVADQPALHGILAKLRNLALPLLLVERVEDGRWTTGDGRPTTDDGRPTTDDGS